MNRYLIKSNQTLNDEITINEALFVDDFDYEKYVSEKRYYKR